MRLRRSNLNKPGYGRRRSGKGFRYLDTDGSALTDAEAVDRIRALVIPPAWTDVWISPDPRGHIQATGYDAAGRKQYLYHHVWRSARDEAKFDHALEVAERLPEVRDRIRHDLVHGRGLTRERVLAAVVGLLDMGMFRVGGASYADREEDPSYGLSTLRPSHVRLLRGRVELRFPGKSGVENGGTVDDGEVAAVLRDLRRRRLGERRLFAYWDPSGRRWREVDAELVNEYLRAAGMTAKDFRTWHGTVAAARSLASAGPRESKSGRAKAVSGAMKEVAAQLGNTPAVARGSYVDPRVVERYEEGSVADVDPDEPRAEAERKVLEFLSEN